MTQGENVDHIASAESIIPQVVATGLSSPVRFHALWAFNGASETGIDWPYDARVRDLSLAGTSVTNTVTVENGEGGLEELSHLVDPSTHNGFTTWVGASRNGSDFLVTWSSDHEVASTIKGSILRHDGTLRTPNGISIPAQAGYAYDRAKAIPVYEGGWQVAYHKQSGDGAVVALSALDGDGVTVQTTELTQPGIRQFGIESLQAAGLLVIAETGNNGKNGSSPQGYLNLISHPACKEPVAPHGRLPNGRLGDTTPRPYHAAPSSAHSMPIELALLDRAAKLLRLEGGNLTQIRAQELQVAASHGIGDAFADAEGVGHDG